MPPKKKKDCPSLAAAWKCLCADFDTRILPMLPYHEQTLKRIVDTWDPTIPNILLYGAPGLPFFPIWNYLVLAPMRRRLKDMTFQHSTFTYNATHLPYTETDAYLHVDLMHPDMPKDGDALLEFLKSVLPSRCMHLHKHIVVIENIDVLTGLGASFAQVMRVLLERYSSNVWFVATTNRVGALESPILSRFLCVRMPLPSHSEVAAILEAIGITGGAPSTRNLVEAMRASDGHVQKPFKITTTLTEVRLEAQRLMQVSATISQLCLEILKQTPEKKRPSILERLAEIEASYHTRKKGRDIFYYEALLLLTCKGTTG